MSVLYGVPSVKIGHIPVRVLDLGGASLLPFRRGNLAFDIESDTIGAGHTETSGIASHLSRVAGLYDQ